MPRKFPVADDVKANENLVVARWQLSSSAEGRNDDGIDDITCYRVLVRTGKTAPLLLATSRMVKTFTGGQIRGSKEQIFRVELLDTWA